MGSLSLCLPLSLSLSLSLPAPLESIILDCGTSTAFTTVSKFTTFCAFKGRMTDTYMLLQNNVFSLEFVSVFVFGLFGGFFWGGGFFVCLFLFCYCCWWSLCIPSLGSALSLKSQLWADISKQTGTLSDIWINTTFNN